MMKASQNFLTFLYLSLFFLSCSSQGNVETNSRPEDVGHSDNNKSVNIEVKDKWELPGSLNEVSGIAFISDNLFACVQDEEGKIFIYNTGTAEIEKEISFAGNGDYEGIALVDKTAYVVRSDGKIYKVENWDSESPAISEYDTPLTEDDNIEGLFYDKPGKQLLLTVKDGDKNKRYKDIYAFDLTVNKLKEEPVIKIDLTDPLLSHNGEKKKAKRFRPSEIGIHPVSGEIYITEGSTARLLIMEKSGEIKNLVQLDEADFPQAEGIAFNPSGEVFISNEAKNGKANILEVAIDQ